MDPLDRISGIGGSRGLAAGNTYNTLENTDLPEVHTIFILNDGGTITELKDSKGANLLTKYQDLLNGSWNINLPITALDGQNFAKIISGTGDLALYTVKGAKVTV